MRATISKYASIGATIVAAALVLIALCAMQELIEFHFNR